MTMLCKACGSAVSTSRDSCNVCNQSFIRSIVLQGAVGSIAASLQVVIGRARLHAVIGDDAKFADSEQFVLERSTAGAWILRPLEGCKNATFINGSAAPINGVELREEDEISIAGKVGRMRVRIVREF